MGAVWIQTAVREACVKKTAARVRSEDNAMGRATQVVLRILNALKDVVLQWSEFPMSRCLRTFANSKDIVAIAPSVFPKIR